MTFEKIKSVSLSLIDKYAQNGRLLTKANPNIHDYYLRMNDFINFAQIIIVKECPIIKKLDLPQAYEIINGYSYFTLPKDFMGIHYIVGADEFKAYFNDISIIGDTILIPCEIVNSITIMYKVLPLLIDENTSENFEPAIRQDLHFLIPLYVAANLIAIENPAKSVNLLNQFEVELSRINNTDKFKTDNVISVYNWN